MKNKVKMMNYSKKFKRVYELAMMKLAKCNIGLYYIVKQFPLYYADCESIDSYACEVEDKYIVFFKSFFKISNNTKELVDELISILLHEIIHITDRHFKRGNDVFKKDKDLDPEIKEKLINISQDVKVDDEVNEIITEIAIQHGTSINYKTMLKHNLSIDVKKSSWEDIYYHLKKNVKVIDIDLINPDMMISKQLVVKDNIVFLRSKLPTTIDSHKLQEQLQQLNTCIINEGNENIKRIKNDEKLNEFIKETLIKGKVLAGSLPGFFERYINELLKPKVNWRTILRQSMTSWISRSYIQTWQKPSRKFKDAPGYRRISTPKIYCFVDESGSIDQKTFNQFMSEIVSMIKIGSEVEVVVWDTEIKKVIKARKASDINVKFKGGGGTEFAPVISKYLNKIKKQDIMIVLTDCQWFDVEKALNLVKKINSRKILVSNKNIPDSFKNVFNVNIKIETNKT